MAELRRFIAGRVALMVPTFLGVTVLTFVVAHLAPGDPFQLDPDTTSGSAIAHASAQVDQSPLAIQYLRWLGHVIRFDFGRSFVDQRPVFDKVLEALPRTLVVSGAALLCAYGFAIPLGVWLARSKSVVARLVSAALTITWSVPSFWIAVLLLLAFASPSGWQIFPMQGLGVLPVVCLALPTLALATRQLRSALLTALQSDYVFAARARGIPERQVLWRHALCTSLLPLVTMAGLSLPHVIGGSVVIERVFGIPGMGLMAFDAVGSRDYPTVMGVATLIALATMVSMLIVDLLYAVIDPRIRVGGGAPP